MKQERIILGIDPGTTIMGFGLIKVVGKLMEFASKSSTKPVEDGLFTPKANCALKVLVSPCENPDKPQKKKTRTIHKRVLNLKSEVIW